MVVGCVRVVAVWLVRVVWVVTVGLVWVVRMVWVVRVVWMVTVRLVWVVWMVRMVGVGVVRVSILEAATRDLSSRLLRSVVRLVKGVARAACYRAQLSYLEDRTETLQHYVSARPHW